MAYKRSSGRCWGCRIVRSCSQEKRIVNDGVMRPGGRRTRQPVRRVAAVVHKHIQNLLACFLGHGFRSGKARANWKGIQLFKVSPVETCRPPTNQEFIKTGLRIYFIISPPLLLQQRHTSALQAAEPRLAVL